MSWALGRAPGSRTTLCTSQVGVWGLLGSGSLGKRDWDVAAPCPSPGNTHGNAQGCSGKGRGRMGLGTRGDTWGQFPPLPRYWKEGMGQNSFSHLSLCQRTKHPINDKKDMAQMPRSILGLLSCGEPGRALQTFLGFWENEAVLGAREAAAGSTRDIQDCWEMLGQFYFPA